MGQLPVIHSNDGFTQLEEVWLGDVYPHEFYDHLEPAVRDVFYRITDITREDLDIIACRLREFGITVRRPVYRDIDHYVDDRGRLIKPEIMPRDHYLAIGQDLIVPNWKQDNQHRWPWQSTVEHYASDINCRVRYHELPIYINGANSVRVGRDFFVDCCWIKQDHADRDLEQIFHDRVRPFFADRRCHYLDNGGHVDSCFAVLRPGLLLTNRYFPDYDRTFPGWHTIMRTAPEFQTHRNRKGPYENGKWLLPAGLGNRAFNDHVIKHAQDWIGDYTETFFEVNCLVINPEHVFMLGDNPGLYNHLKDLGITAHSLPFRCRTFWDGGLHCLTLDIRRQGGIEDYFTHTS